jgi:hypothetical protein
MPVRQVTILHHPQAARCRPLRLPPLRPYLLQVLLKRHPLHALLFVGRAINGQQPGSTTERGRSKFSQSLFNAFFASRFSSQQEPTFTWSIGSNAPRSSTRPQRSSGTLHESLATSASVSAAANSSDAGATAAPTTARVDLMTCRPRPVYTLTPKCPIDRSDPWICSVVATHDDKLVIARQIPPTPK